MERLPAVDRAILRVAVWELLHAEDVPEPVAVDEAVELAKQLSTDDSPGFVNGVLGQVMLVTPQIRRPRRRFAGRVTGAQARNGSTAGLGAVFERGRGGQGVPAIEPVGGHQSGAAVPRPVDRTGQHNLESRCGTEPICDIESICCAGHFDQNSVVISDDDDLTRITTLRAVTDGHVSQIIGHFGHGQSTPSPCWYS